MPRPPEASPEKMAIWEAERKAFIARNSRGVIDWDNPVAREGFYAAQWLRGKLRDAGASDRHMRVSALTLGSVLGEGERLFEAGVLTERFDPWGHLYT